jgi:hypothetical protein
MGTLVGGVDRSTSKNEIREMTPFCVVASRSLYFTLIYIHHFGISIASLGLSRLGNNRLSGKSG